MGIGEIMLKAVLEEILEKGTPFVTLEVRKSNEAAILLYRKFGFEVIGTRTRYYRDNDEDAHIMALNSNNN
jgi:ribosomal-protein-alanine N-acetyltransferase